MSTDINKKIDDEIAAAAASGNLPVTNEQINQVLARVEATIASADITLAANRKVNNPRYHVTESTNRFTGLHFMVQDSQRDDETVAIFNDLGRYSREFWDYGRFIVEESIGRANADLFCQILNVQWEASHAE